MQAILGHRHAAVERLRPRRPSHRSGEEATEARAGHARTGNGTESTLRALGDAFLALLGVQRF
jgi:hypothetical protein